MARNHRAGEAIPVVRGPIPPPCSGPHHERSIGDPRAHHHIGPGSERGSDTPATEVGVGRDRRAQQRRAGVEVRELRAQPIDTAHQVVALHMGHVHREAELGGDLAHSLGATRRIQPTGIGDHLDAAVDAGTEHLFHLREEGAGIPQLGVAGALLVEDEHGELGQPVAG